MNVERVRAPDERGAQERAWAVVRSVYSERPVHVHRKARIRMLLIPATLVVAASLALTPAGASVRHWIDRTFGVSHPSHALFGLPASGRLLVSGSGGTWIVHADGSRRRLGPWSDATWSPRGRYLGVVGPDELAAVDPRGTVRWSVARPAVADPRWSEPTGFRVAYLSGSTLRVIAGDGTGDRLLADGVAALAPAWRPNHAYELAYVTSTDRVVVRDSDTGALWWARRLPAVPRLLAWTNDGARLVALTRGALLVFDAQGHIVRRMAVDAQDFTISPDGREVALLGDRDVTIAQLPPWPAAPRRVFAGDGLRQVTWSPDGRWLLVSWPAADQWVFIRAGASPRIEAVSRIAEQFAGGTPTIDGWCCS